MVAFPWQQSAHLHGYQLTASATSATSAAATAAIKVGRSGKYQIEHQRVQEKYVNSNAADDKHRVSHIAQ